MEYSMPIKKIIFLL